VVALAPKSLLIKLANAFLMYPPPAFQVDSRDERQRYAIKKLHGRHLWRRHELAIATGFVDEPEKLTTRLTHLFGRNWKEYFMYLVLFFSLVSVGKK